MESIQLGGRRVSGFGVGAVRDQSVFVKPAAEFEGSVVRPITKKLGAFVGTALLGGVAGVAATALFGEGSGAMAGAGGRIQRSWRVLAATAVASGIAGAIVA